MSLSSIPSCKITKSLAILYNPKINNLNYTRAIPVSITNCGKKVLKEFLICLGNKNVVETLIRNRANLDLVDDDGNTVLFSAIEGGNN